MKKLNIWMMLFIIALIGEGYHYHKNIYRIFKPAEYKGMKLLGEYEITGYDNSDLSIDVEKWRDGKTAMGLHTHVGIVAADPRFIPKGSTVFIPDCGYFLVADVGGAIKFHKLDLFFWKQKDAKEWGRQFRKVYLVKIR